MDHIDFPIADPVEAKPHSLLVSVNLWHSINTALSHTNIHLRIVYEWLMNSTLALRCVCVFGLEAWRLTFEESDHWPCCGLIAPSTCDCNCGCDCDVLDHMLPLLATEFVVKEFAITHALARQLWCGVVRVVYKSVGNWFRLKNIRDRARETGRRRGYLKHEHERSSSTSAPLWLMCVCAVCLGWFLFFFLRISISFF